MDHTQGNPLGRYIYFRGDGQTQRLMGALKSHQFDAMDEDGLLCFEFWYHMNGDNVLIPDLTIAIVNNDNTNIKEVWYLSRSEGDDWRLARVPILSTEPFSVLVYGAASSTDLGYAGWFIIAGILVYIIQVLFNFFFFKVTLLWMISFSTMLNANSLRNMPIPILG